MLYYVENLNIIAWLFQILPRLWSERVRCNIRSTLFFIDATPTGLVCARATIWLARVELTHLDFRLIDIRDKKGLLLRLRIPYRDLFEVQRSAIRSASFQQYVAQAKLPESLRAYLEKTITIQGFSPRGNIWHALFIVHVARWKANRESVTGNVVLFVTCRPWGAVVKKYGENFRVNVVEVSSGINVKQWLRTILSPSTLDRFRAIRGRLYNVKLRRNIGELFRRRSQRPESSSFKIGVEYSGYLNLDDPSKHSNLFFWQQSDIPGEDILLMFGFRLDPLDEDKFKELTRHRVTAAALYPGASTVPSVPVFVPRLRVSSSQHVPSVGRGLERKWLCTQINQYETLRAYWQEVFDTYTIQLYLTWYRYDARHFAITAALRELGGVMAIYQRAFQPDASPELAVNADLMFGYSPYDAEVERHSGSKIDYHVAVGYLGDHRFPLLKQSAHNVRESLLAHGAQYVVAYFDENSTDDARWHTGHEFMRENYQFLLERVLQEPSLGVVLKPKYPSNLRKRLGPVNELFEQALATGRVSIFEAGPLHGSHPPAEAALAADLAIHGHLCAANAGLEAALAGVPTLLLDREGWSVSSLYQLGIGKVVFRDWDALWDSVHVHRNRAGGIPGFGDWSSMINQFDPFRDGKAAQRMGTYLKWVLDGLKEGMDRDRVLADAAERYAKIWGADKITRVGVQ